MTDFFIKQGDRLPAMRAILKDATGAVIDVTGYLSLTFKMRDREKTGGIVVSAAMTINDAPAGDVQYDWAAGDTATAGSFIGEIDGVDPAGLAITFPNFRDIEIEIKEDVDA